MNAIGDKNTSIKFKTWALKVLIIVVAIGVLAIVTIEVAYYVNSNRNKKVWQAAYDRCGRDPIIGMQAYGGPRNYYLPGDYTYEYEKKKDFTGKYMVNGKDYYCTEDEAKQAKRIHQDEPNIDWTSYDEL